MRDSLPGDGRPLRPSSARPILHVGRAEEESAAVRKLWGLV